MAKVVKPFKSTLRRFKAGTEVSETDDVSPHSFADLAARGFIANDRAASESTPFEDSGPHA